VKRQGAARPKAKKRLQGMAGQTPERGEARRKKSELWAKQTQDASDQELRGKLARWRMKVETIRRRRMPPKHKATLPIT
jgi:hypothetical protein